MKQQIDPSFQLLGAKYIHKQLNALTKQFSGIRENQDIECLHQARVASRRLRTALQAFAACFPDKKRKRWRKILRRVTRKLGRARDKDVAIDFLNAYLDELQDKAPRKGLRRIRLRLQQTRSGKQGNVLKVVRRLDKSPELDEMFAEVGQIQFALERHDIPATSVSVFEQAAEQIGRHLADVFEQQFSLADEAAIEHHHKMRIAAKRLRYAMEIYQPVYEGRLDDLIKAAKHLQTLLGDLHDCDVWEEFLDGFAHEELQRTVDYFGHERPFARLEPGIAHLRENRRRERKRLFNKLANYWQTLQEEHVWDRLRELLQQHAETIPPAAPPQKTTKIVETSYPPDAAPLAQSPLPRSPETLS